ncbi:hypothetical protein JCM33374_g3308 [Metschnikowia sp. JCM 33374]|nr:hypothetical protein JCM33374_g3308 [Metschnikowia sp. JCM 33374]
MLGIACTSPRLKIPIGFQNDCFEPTPVEIPKSQTSSPQCHHPLFSTSPHFTTPQRFRYSAYFFSTSSSMFKPVTLEMDFLTLSHPWCTFCWPEEADSSTTLTKPLACSKAATWCLATSGNAFCSTRHKKSVVLWKVWGKKYRKATTPNANGYGTGDKVSLACQDVSRKPGNHNVDGVGKQVLMLAVESSHRAGDSTLLLENRVFLVVEVGVGGRVAIIQRQADPPHGRLERRRRPHRHTVHKGARAQQLRLGVCARGDSSWQGNHQHFVFVELSFGLVLNGTFGGRVRHKSRGHASEGQKGSGHFGKVQFEVSVDAFGGLDGGVEDRW